MREPITPALSVEQWAKWPLGVYGWDDGSVFISTHDDNGEPKIEDGTPATIAVLNALLPDCDPRKITRQRVELMHEVASTVKRDGGADPSVDHCDSLLHAFADALASYLPPDPT